MKRCNIIEGFEPFNEVLYKDCYYHGLIPVFKYFVGFIESFLLNDIRFYYSFKESENGIVIGCDSIFHIEEKENLLQYGIACHEVLETEHIVEDLVECISKNEPAIIRIDCFYEPLRMDSYNSFHASHAIPVYGYNLDKREFYILEAKFIDSVSYAKNSISFDDLERAYKGYIDRFYDGSKNTLESFYIKEELTPEKYRSIYLQKYQAVCDSILTGKEKYEDSQSNLVKYKNRILDVLRSNEYESIGKENFINSLNNLINNLNMQRYLFNKVFQCDSDLIRCVDSITCNWKSIRAIIAKYKLRKKIEVKSIEAIEVKLQNLIELEQSKYNMLTTFFYNGVS
ncbi:MAG TPA: hypothetical protein DCW90_16935 [Lachnospiraceae bacterium]|nr:hypothetical protein [uncultured Lachnoclostridium sp.]HAU87104.1 hypothetical protein [Lachnospiraceae bacterium]